MMAPEGRAPTWHWQTTLNASSESISASGKFTLLSWPLRRRGHAGDRPDVRLAVLLRDADPHGEEVPGLSRDFRSGGTTGFRPGRGGPPLPRGGASGAPAGWRPSRTSGSDVRSSSAIPGAGGRGPRPRPSPLRPTSTDPPKTAPPSTRPSSPIFTLCAMWARASIFVPPADPPLPHRRPGERRGVPALLRSTGTPGHADFSQESLEKPEDFRSLPRNVFINVVGRGISLLS